VFLYHDYDTTISKYAMENNNWLPIIRIRLMGPSSTKGAVTMSATSRTPTSATPIVHAAINDAFKHAQRILEEYSAKRR
jgi:hypothetical protein